MERRFSNWLNGETFCYLTSKLDLKLLKPAHLKRYFCKVIVNRGQPTSTKSLEPQVCTKSKYRTLDFIETKIKTHRHEKCEREATVTSAGSSSHERIRKVSLVYILWFTSSGHVDCFLVALYHRFRT